MDRRLDQAPRGGHHELEPCSYELERVLALTVDKPSIPFSLTLKHQGVFQNIADGSYIRLGMDDAMIHSAVI